MDTTGDAQALLQPYRLKDLTLSSRVVMAPLTRTRADNARFLPSELHAEYYAQRATAGLIVSEGVWISRAAVGWNDVPGIFTDEQVRSWAAVTGAVHDAGGVIFAQLWHTGSLSHPDFFAGKAPLAPSAVNPLQRTSAPTGRKDTVLPRAMTTAEIHETVRDFATAARNAMRAGFDGVQLQAGFHYLISQFLNPLTNIREDEYGGFTENRARFLFEILDAVGEVVDLRRVGVKTGPALSETGMFVSSAETLATSDYVITRLNNYDLSHLLLMGAMAELPDAAADLQGDGMFSRFRGLYHGTIIANVGFDQTRGNRIIEEGLADMVAFGKPFIANPDLPHRFAAHVPLIEGDPRTYYGSGAKGYTDYPALEVEPSCRVPEGCLATWRGSGGGLVGAASRGRATGRCCV
jgi:N-ethylmaleimide reductase